MLKIQLQNNAIGQVTLETDPSEINAIIQDIKRSEKFEGVINEVITNLTLSKEGRRFVKRAFEADGGLDCVVIVNLFGYDPNGRRWVLEYTGQINFNQYEVHEDVLIVTLHQVGFQSNILNLMNTDVDLDNVLSHDGSQIIGDYDNGHTPFYPFQLPVNVPFHSKTIIKQSKVGPIDEEENDFLPSELDFNFQVPLCITPGGCDHGIDITIYGQIDVTKQIFKELNTLSSISWGYSTEGVFPIYIADEAGTLNFDSKLRLKSTFYTPAVATDVTFPTFGGFFGAIETKAWFKHTDIHGAVIQETAIGTRIFAGVQVNDVDSLGNAIVAAIDNDIAFDYSVDDLPVSIGDKFYFYLTARMHGTATIPFGLGPEGRIYGVKIQSIDQDNTYADFIQKTTAPETIIKVQLIHEAIQKCLQFYTNLNDCFRSTLVGRTDIIAPDGTHPYDVDGEYSLIGITSGTCLRQTSKSIFASFETLLNFIDSLACVGFGFEQIGSKRYLRLEKRSYFYNRKLKILSLGEVADVVMTLSAGRFINQFEYGYGVKIDMGGAQVNAIDEFNTLRRSILPISNTKNQKSVATKIHGSGFEIEFQRRLVGKTVDSNLDTALFAAVLIRDGDGFKTKKMEGYDSILNILVPETGYNYDISPARNLINWLPYIASNLRFSSSKVLKFSYGEINYSMKSKKTGEADYVDESGDVDLTGIIPLYDNFDYKFSAPIDRSQVAQVKQFPYGYIEFKDLLGGVMGGFVNPDGVAYDREEGQAEFHLLKVF